MSQFYHYNDVNGTGVFEILNEKLNIFNTSDVVNQFRSIIERGSGAAVVVDLKNVTHIDSVGIGFLIAIKNISSKKGCDIHLVCSNEIVLKVLKITKMDSFFNIFNNLDDAMNYINSRK